MALDIITQKKILDDILKDASSAGYTTEESTFRKALEKDVELAKKNNWVIKVPSEWEVE